MRLSRLTTVLAGTTLAAGLITVVSPTAGASQQTLYCKRVTAQNIRVFTSASGDGIYGYYNRDTVYNVDRTDAPNNRYHVPNYPSASGQAWTTSDPSYVTSC